MKKILSVVVITVLLIGCLSVSALAAGNANMTVSSASGQPGDTVTLTVTLASNPGVAYLNIPVSYDDTRLEAPTITGTGLSGWTIRASATWADADNSTYTGTVLELTFKIKDNAPDGQAIVSLGTIEAWDAEEEAVTVSTSSGTVTISHDHVWSDWSVTTAATCTEGGVEARTCTICGESETRATDPLGHDWGDWSVTKAATCQEEGIETRVCKHDSSHTETRAIPVTSHTWGTWTETKAATCTAGGEETRTCSVCGQTETRATSPLGHDWGAWAVTKAATCDEAGVETRTCKHDSSHTETRAVPALGHDWDDGTVTKEATEDEEGVMTYTCKNDPSHIKTEVIAKLVPGVTPTPTPSKKPATTSQPVQTSKPYAPTKTSSDVPKTGNENGILIWCGLLVLCGAGVGTAIYRKRSRN